MQIMEVWKEIEKISERKGFPGIVTETAVGTIHDSDNWETTREEVLQIMREATTAKEVVKKLQPIIAREK